MPTATVVYQLRAAVQPIPVGETARVRIERPTRTLACFIPDNTDPALAWVRKITGPAGGESIGVKKPAGSTDPSVTINLLIVDSDGETFLAPQAGGLRFKKADEDQDAGNTIFGGFTLGSVPSVTVNGQTFTDKPCLTITDTAADTTTTEYSLFMTFGDGSSNNRLLGLLDPKITNN